MLIRVNNRYIGFGFGLIFFLVTHLVLLDQVAGLHFDEAWAANFSAQIAHLGLQNGLAAMSPYTAPWGHLWASLLFKFFGISLFVFRLSGVLLCLAGLSFLSLAL